MRRRLAGIVATVLVAHIAGACAGSPETEPAASVDGSVAPSRTWHVPTDQPTIADAVAVARPGDLVLVAAGRYPESVRVTTPGITVRGADRNDVVIDGGNRLDVGISIEADGVAIENLTVRSFAGDAIRVGPAAATSDTAAAPAATPTSTAETAVPTATTATPASTATATGGPSPTAGGAGSARAAPAAAAASPQRYRIAYVTAANSGAAGIRIAGARGGSIDHVLTSDLADAGLVVRGCQPCDLVVTDTTFQLSRLGVDLDGAGGVVVARSTVHRNRSGVRVGPHGGGGGDDAMVTLVGLDVAANDNGDAASPADQTWGDGIVVLGPDVAVLRNRVVGHRHAGIWLTGLPASAVERVEVAGNVLRANGVDLLVGAAGTPLVTVDTCFADNQAATDVPPGVTATLRCGAPADPSATPWPPLAASDTSLPGRDFRLVPLPAPQPSMPGAPDALPAPVSGRPPFDVGAVTVPTS